MTLDQMKSLRASEFQAAYEGARARAQSLRRTFANNPTETTWLAVEAADREARQLEAMTWRTLTP